MARALCDEVLCRCFIYSRYMRFFSVLFAGGVMASLSFSCFAQTATSSPQAAQQQTAPATAPSSSQTQTPQLKLENLPPDPHTPTPEELAAEAAARQRAQIIRVASAQANWGPKASTPGITLTMKEVGREKTAAGTQITYQLTGTGFPASARLTLVRWPLNQPVTPVMDGIVIDASGRAVCEAQASATIAATNAPTADANASASSAPNPASDGLSCLKTLQANAPVEISTTAAKGEAVRLALVGEDKKSGAATSAVPFPLEGENKGCKLQVLLGSKNAELVLIEGEGFKPNEPYTLGTETYGVKGKLGAKPDASGHFVSAITPYQEGHESGDTVVYYQSDSCTPTLSFHWGKDSYKVE
jgi:hypothetical protein